MLLNLKKKTVEIKKKKMCSKYPLDVLFFVFFVNLFLYLKIWNKTHFFNNAFVTLQFYTTTYPKQP